MPTSSMRFSKSIAFIFLAATLLSFGVQSDFLTQQKKFSRVRSAVTEKQIFIDKKLKENNIALNKLNVLFVAYKDNELFEVYGKQQQETTYKKLLTYEICNRSGQLGPKRKQGDGQVPEGFYHIDRFNPASNFYLSLGLNYPNLSDKRKSTSSNLGGDIFIHGNCVTIGCMPMTDDKIKEIYLLAVHAKNNGQHTIPVYVFPFQMTDQNFNSYKTKYASNKPLLAFWANLKVGYDRFMQSKKALTVQVAENGAYTFGK